MKRSIITLEDMNESLFRNFRILESLAYESVMFATSLKLFRTVCLAAERVVDLESITAFSWLSSYLDFNYV